MNSLQLSTFTFTCFQQFVLKTGKLDSTNGFIEHQT